MSVIVALSLAAVVVLLVPGPVRRRSPLTLPLVRLIPARNPLTRSRARALRRRQAVSWVDGVVAELRAGRPARLALTEQPDAPCHRAVAAVRLGGDVVEALHADAREQELALFAHVAACWSVAESSGAGLVAALEQVVASARADEEIRAEISAQLAAPRATARMLAVLPVFGLVLGSSMGASPVAWLVASPIGWAVLAVGLVEIAAGLWWTGRMVASIEIDLAGSRPQRRRTQ